MKRLQMMEYTKKGLVENVKNLGMSKMLKLKEKVDKCWNKKTQESFHRFYGVDIIKWSLFERSKF